MKPLRAFALLVPCLSACTVDSSSSYGFADGRQSVYQDWAPCEPNGTAAVECAKIVVPLDYSEPAGPRILIALNRLRASGEHLGTVLLNPGGPGGSGREMLFDWASDGLPEQLAPGFDFVGFDPRGVGESTRGRCDILDQVVASNGDMRDAADAMLEPSAPSELERTEAIRFLGEQCRLSWGPLFDHLGSHHVVRDMDAIREFLEEESLNFIGTSYGTRLGALYAQTFPERTRAIVLDAPMAPIADTVELSRGQFKQTVRLHEVVFELCEQGELPCPQAPRAVFDQLLAAADRVGYRREVMDLWLRGLTYWQGLATIPSLLNQQAAAEDDQWIQRMVDRLESAEGVPAVGQRAELVTNLAVHCADNASYSLAIEQAEQLVSEAYVSSPLFGNLMEGVSACSGWPVATDPVPPLEARDAPPLLIVGGSSDRLTPLEWAEALDTSLESSVLLRSTHWGHGIVDGDVGCVRDAISSYLVDLVLPEEGTVCDAPLELGRDLSQPE